MLSAAFTDAFPPPASVAGAPGLLGTSVKREPCSDDEEIEDIVNLNVDDILNGDDKNDE